MISQVFDPTLIQFLLVGGTFSVSYALINAALVSVGAPPFGSELFLYALAIPRAYNAQKNFTFRVRNAEYGSFLVYLATQLGSFALPTGASSQFVAQVF